MIDNPVGPCPACGGPEAWVGPKYEAGYPIPAVPFGAFEWVREQLTWRCDRCGFKVARDTERVAEQKRPEAERPKPAPAVPWYRRLLGAPTGR